METFRRLLVITQHHAKRSLKSLVNVIPKEGFCVVCSAMHVHPSFGMTPTFDFSLKVGVIPKKGACCMLTHPSFGMTPTQAIEDLFLWRCPFEHCTVVKERKLTGIHIFINLVKSFMWLLL